jgi:hypothetical protein
MCGHEVAKCNQAITTWSILVMYRHEATKVAFWLDIKKPFGKHFWHKTTSVFG